MGLHNNLGVVLCSLGHKEQALACYEKAITIDPNCADAYYNAAKIMEEQNRRKEAIAYCQKAIAIKPKAEFYNRLGIYYKGCENLAEAIAYCQKAIAIKPKAEFYNQLGIYYKGCENLAEAAKQYEQAIALKPNYPEAICNLGWILQEQGKIAEALGQYRQALAIKPDDPGAYDKMGIALQEQGKLAEAIACHQKAIALKPDLAEAYSNLGLALQEQLKLQEAIGYYRHAVALNPDAVTAHLNLGMCLLLLQDLSQGFAEYEWRWREWTKSQTLEERYGCATLRDGGKPLWDGSSLAGKTILLHTEQGHGDAIQFVRYAPLVAQRGAGKVILETYRSLRRLFTTVSLVQEVVVKDEPLPAFDVQVPLMSLPHILGTTIETIPDRVPYLYAEEKEAVKYSELLRTEGEVKVGIVWAANAKSHTASKRSCPVSLFLELSQIPGISLYSLHNTGKLAEAVSVYREAIALNPQNINLHNNLGSALHSLGHEEQALACYEKAITIDQNCADAYYNAARIMEVQYRREEAISYCQKAIAIKPEAKFYNELGIYYQRCGNLAEAARQYEQAIALKPNCLEAICNLGMILKKQGKIAEAIGQYRQALAIKPDDPEVYYKMGLAWGEQDKLVEKIACYQKAIALKPDFVEAYIDLGIALQEQLKLQEAMGYYRHAIALKPDAEKAHMGLGMCSLLLQDLSQGFVEYEWRWWTKSQTPEERLGKPLWDGSPLAGKTILLHTEQGHGDAIQFVRYTPLVAQRGAGKVILETYRSLRRLFTTVSLVREVVVKGEPLPAFDVQVPLMSLPRILGTTIETIPDRILYLYAEEKEAVKYSGAKSPTARKRSCPVSLFLELLQIPGISLYSLQKEHTDILDGAPIQDLSTHLHDFADTTAVISQLDLVISVDTAVAH